MKGPEHSNELLHRLLNNYKGKRLHLQWYKLAETTLTKQSITRNYIINNGIN